jgi:hypothetical protein
MRWMAPYWSDHPLHRGHRLLQVPRSAGERLSSSKAPWKWLIIRFTTVHVVPSHSQHRREGRDVSNLHCPALTSTTGQLGHPRGAYSDNCQLFSRSRAPRGRTRRCTAESDCTTGSHHPTAAAELQAVSANCCGCTHQLVHQRYQLAALWWASGDAWRAAGLRQGAAAGRHALQSAATQHHA